MWTVAEAKGWRLGLSVHTGETVVQAILFYFIARIKVFIYIMIALGICDKKYNYRSCGISF